ncbi:MAG: NAD-dependent epimerase/dehydratase family protein [Candidatus Bathyarchaeia archaeon]
MGGRSISKELLSKKILITGSSGFIGSHLCKALPHADGLSRTPSQTTNILGDVASLPISVDKYDIIYHLAAVVYPEVSVRNPLDTYMINICGTLNLVQSFRGLFIYPSTVGVHEPLRNPYLLSKYVCEEIVRAAPCEHMIFRLANLYGEGSKSVIQKWLNADRIQIYGDGNQVRDFTYIGDIIDILANPLKLQVGRTYYVGTGVPTTLNELAEQIIALTGEKKIEHLPAREFEIYEPFIKPDLTCPTTLKEGLLKCLKKGVT